MRVHDTASGEPVDDRPATGRPGSTSAASRRTTPPTSATPRPTSASTCSTGPGATPGHDVRYVQNVTDVDDPLLERADARCTSTGTSSPSGRPSCSARTWRPCASSRRTHYVGAVESIPLVVDAGPAARRTPGSVYGVDDDLYFSVTADPAFGRSRARPRDRCSRSSASAAATRSGRARRTRWTASSGAAERDGRAGVGQPVRPRPAGLARRVHRDRAASTSAPPSTSRAVAATWSSRTTRCARGQAQVADPAAPFAQAYGHAGMVGVRRREDVEVAGQPGLRLARCATATSTRWRSGWRCCATTTARTGSGPTPSSGTPSTRWRTWRRALVAGRGRTAAEPSSPPCSPRWPTTSTPRRRRRRRAARGSTRTLGTAGLADTSDPDAVASVSTRSSDAALGLAL